MRMPTGAVVMAIAIACLCTAMSARAQVDLDAYLKKDRYGEITISPDGTYYAATMPLEDRTALVVLRRADKQVTATVTGDKDSVVGDFWWASDTRLVVAMALKLGSRDEPYLTGELHAVGADGAKPFKLVGEIDQPGLVSTIALASDGWAGATVIDPLRDDARKVLIAAYGYSNMPTTRVENLDIYTGRTSPVAAAPVRRADFTVDASAAVRFADGAGEDNMRKLYYRDAGAIDWRLVNDQAQSGHVETALGFSADGATAYLQVEQAGGPDAIVAWDPKTGARRELLRDPVVDPYAVVRGVDGRTPVGVLYMDGGVRSRFFDETGSDAMLQRTLETAFPGDAIVITSRTRDGRYAVVETWNARSPGDVYLYDTTTRRADAIFARRLWLDPAKAAASRTFETAARDGTALHGDLTLPNDAGTGLPPLVVMPHGGPFGVFDAWGFDEEAQLLATAGYAVLRVNYRGSGNYGHAFRVAGARQWGGVMQDDLTDATRWAIAQELVDPARICLYGASYGGYAALMGVAKEPGLYKCAAGYVGIYDLELMARDDARTAAWMRNWSEDWVGERGTLKEKSPVNLAASIKAPVFLAAGGQDRRAPIEQSRRMQRALEAAGTPVETLYFDSEGHGFYTPAHQHEFYARLLRFLAHNIGGKAP